MNCCKGNEFARGNSGRKSCGCHEHGMKRKFYSQAERKESLEMYKKDLESELEGVQEKIAELS